VIGGEAIHNPTSVRLNPDLFPGSGDHADGGWYTSAVITHEFGHILGHNDYAGCAPGGVGTVMDRDHVCINPATGRWYETPQPQDVTNYNDAYRPNAVTSFQGSSPALGQVNLTWNPSSVHAEAMFRVNRWPAGQGCCGTEAGTAAKNASGITLYNQPSGSQTYHVWAWTYALGYGYGDWVDEVTVNVQGSTPPSPPASVSLSGSNGSGSVSWSSVSGATSYQVFVNRWNNGNQVTVVNWANDTASPYSFSYTVSDWYHAAVKACNAAGCSTHRDSNPFWVWLTKPPNAPTNVTITQNYNGNSYGVRLCWTDNSSNESKFQVRAFAYWDNQTWTWDVNPNTTCFNAVFYADAWHFCVRSVGAGGESYGWVSVTKPTSTNVYYVNVPCSQTYCQNSGNTNNNPHQH
jgi:hypothetical protein